MLSKIIKIHNEKNNLDKFFLLIKKKPSLIFNKEIIDNAITSVKNKKQNEEKDKLNIIASFESVRILSEVSKLNFTNKYMK